MKNFKLGILTVLKILFFIITYPFSWLIMIVELLLYFISFGKIDKSFTLNFNEFCLFVLKKILDKEFEIIFNYQKEKIS